MIACSKNQTFPFSFSYILKNYRIYKTNKIIKQREKLDMNRILHE